MSNLPSSNLIPAVLTNARVDFTRSGRATMSAEKNSANTRPTLSARYRSHCRRG